MQWVNIELYVCSAIRWYATVKANLHRQSEIGTQSTNAVFRTGVQTTSSTDDEFDFTELIRDLSGQLDRFTNQGSHWILNRITDFTVHDVQYRPLIGSSYITSPEFISSKKAVVNVKNQYDNK